MLALLAGALLSSAIAAVVPTAPPQMCSSDTFTIDDRTVVAHVCVPLNVALASDGSARVPVSETFTAGDKSVSHATSIDFQTNGTELSRTIDDVDLGGLGIARSAHVTIGYRPGIVRLEHALLTPGARALK